MTSPVRLRFAPSPTGYLHVGGARTALFNYLYAKTQGGQCILRIEDTDQNRSTSEAVNQVLESLRWLGIDWDEGPGNEKENFSEIGSYGPYFQSQRLQIYQEHFDRLLKKKKIYPCFCTDEVLDQKRKRMEAMGYPFVYDRQCLNLSSEEISEKLTHHVPHTLRFRIEPREIIFEDKVKGVVKFDSSLIGDFVIRKSDGFPTYNFAVVVDDATMKITHIIRGDDHISNTPRQILIYEALGYPLPIFAHISMILGHEGEKLSKRLGSVSVLDYKKKGYYPDPFINFLALLGWSPSDGNEILSREELIRSFTELKFSPSPAIFDHNKLDFLNGRYLRNLNATILYRDLRNTLIEHGVVREEKDFPPNLKDILAVLKDYCNKLSDIVLVYNKFMETRVHYTDEIKPWISDANKPLFILAIEIFSQKDDPFIVPEEFQELISRAKEKGFKGKGFFMPLRAKLTGEEHGIELDTLFRLKPRSVILERLS